MSEKYLKYKHKYLSLKNKYELINKDYQLLIPNDNSLSQIQTINKDSQLLIPPSISTMITTPTQISIWNNPICKLTKNSDIITNNPFIFNHSVTGEFKITDQKLSGRCWLFATLNMVRFLACDLWKTEMDTKELEFSQSYLFFWDKYERYHRYLNYFLDINSKPDSDLKQHLFTFICNKPLSDGGQWDMVKEVIKKYGIVPKTIYPDSYHAGNSEKMNEILTEMLKQDWIILSNKTQELVDKLIPEMMNKVFNTLVSFLGKPPTTFDWEFIYEKNTKVWKYMTPLKLLEKTGFVPDDWVSIVNDPRKENGYNKYYQIEYIGNVKNQHVGWLNVEMKRLKEMAVESINSNNSVWVGCDVGAHRDTESGIHAPNVNKYHELLELQNTMNKEDRIRYYSSVPSHAMVITAYHLDNNIVKRWKVENSWGDKKGFNGYLLFTDEWFDEYVFQIVVHKKHLNPQEKNALTQEAIKVKPWDAISVLAS